jgi:hypothetical protein
MDNKKLVKGVTVGLLIAGLAVLGLKAFYLNPVEAVFGGWANWAYGGIAIGGAYGAFAKQ